MDSTTFTENYLRLHLLEVKGGTAVLKELLLKVVRNSSAKGNIAKFLEVFENDIKQAKSSASTEYQMLFQSPQDISKWDISLLAYVLIHCCSLEGQLSLKGKLNPKEILKKEIGVTNSQSLDAFLLYHQGSIDQLRSTDITDEQYAKLYPSADVKVWGIELLLCILFRLCSGINLQNVRKVCRDVVVREVSLCDSDTGLNLDAFLLKRKDTFDALRRQRKLSDSQYEQLFPTENLKSDYSNWDDDVLRIVVLNACQAMIKKTHDAVKIIRQLRKELGAHPTTTEIDNDNFGEKWDSLNFALHDIIKYDVPSIKKEVDIATRTFKYGPLDIQSSIELIKEHNRENCTVLEKMNGLETNIQRQFQVMKEEILKTLRSNPDQTYSEQAEIKCFAVIFVVKGSNREAVDKAEQIIKKAMAGIEDDDTQRTQAVMNAIINDILKDGTVIVEIRKGSIILVLRCNSLKGLYTLLNTMDSTELQFKIQELASVLTEQIGYPISIVFHISSYSLQALFDHTSKHEGSVTLRIKPTSLMGLNNLLETLQDGEMTANLQQLSEGLSNQLGTTINVRASIRGAIQTAESGNHHSQYTSYDSIPNNNIDRQPQTPSLIPGISTWNEDEAAVSQGTGSCLTEEGTIEMDAVIMDEKTVSSGAMASVHNIKNPLLLAREVTEKEISLTSDRNRKVIEHVEKGGWKNYDKFKQCLLKTKQEHLLGDLQKQEDIELEKLRADHKNGQGDDGNDDDGDDGGDGSGENRDGGSNESDFNDKSTLPCPDMFGKDKDHINDSPDQRGQAEIRDSQSKTTETKVKDKEETAKRLLQELVKFKDWDSFEQKANEIQQQEHKFQLPNAVPTRNVGLGTNISGCPREFQAYRTSGKDNSCLYQSISKLINGTEDYQVRLRLAAVLHAATNVIKYIKKHLMTLEQQSMDAVLQFFSTHLSEQSYQELSGNSDMQKDGLIKNGIKLSIMETAVLGKDSSQLQVVFLCGALGRRIIEFFQKKTDYGQYRELMVEGDKTELDSEPFHIMWVNFNGDPQGPLNHIVPLLKRS